MIIIKGGKILLHAVHMLYGRFSANHVYPLVPRLVCVSGSPATKHIEKEKANIESLPLASTDYVHAPTFFAGISLIVATMSLRGRESSSPRLMLSGLITLRLRSHLQGRSPPFPPSGIIRTARRRLRISPREEEDAEMVSSYIWHRPPAPVLSAHS